MADKFAIIGVGKLKTSGNIGGVLDHMERKRKTENSNGRDNDILIKPPPLPEIMQRIREYIPRKNAVFAYDFLMTASPEFFQGKTEADIKQWEQDSLNWCKSVFGAENVIGAVCHRDETTPHIQALIIPEHEGKLNAKHFTGGREKLRNLWTSYAQAMKPWGLKRGRLYSPAEHKTIKQYYADINRAAEKAARAAIRPEQLPEPGLKDHANPRQYAAPLVNYAIKTMQQRNANLSAALEAERQEKQKIIAATAKEREASLFLKENPDAFRKIRAELEAEREARAADQTRYKKLLQAVRQYFRRNVAKNSVNRTPERLGMLAAFPELQKDLAIDLKAGATERPVKERTL